MNSNALVLFSGGQDSTTCLAWALNQFEYVETIGFDYKQRHAIELECRTKVFDRFRTDFPEWRQKLGEDHLLDLSILGKVSETALTQEAEITFSQEGLPNTFVPGRNLLFFTMAATIAYRRNIKHLVGGMCETDYSGYPDCRDDTLKAMQIALNLGMESRFVLHTPLMWIDKAETFRLAEELGGQALVALICEETHTCYLGDRSQRHPWGYGCNECPACHLRKTGYQKYKGEA